LVDKVIYTELPDPLWDPIDKLTTIVTSQISYGPYSHIVRKTPVALLIYQKRFPKAFAAITIIYKDGYPEYRYRNNGYIFTVRKPGFPDQEVVCNNHWIVLYNLYLL
jgi:hypothetical protein